MSVTYNGYDLEAGDANQPETQGAVLLGRGTYGAPERDVEQIHVPGRDGDLLLDNGGYKNIQITYPCSIREYNPTVSQWLRSVLYGAPGYHRLEDSYHPDEFRLAEYRGPFEPEVYSERGNDAANVDLVFNCHPQRYLEKGAEKQQFVCGPLVDGAQRFVIIVSENGSPSAGKILKIKLLNSNTNIQLRSCKGTRYFNTSWTDISSRVQRVVAGTSNAPHIEFTLTTTNDTGLVEFELEQYNSWGDRIEVSIGDKVLPVFKWASGGGAIVQYDISDWVGRPIITIYGWRNSNSDTLTGRYMSKIFSLNLPSTIAAGASMKIVIDCTKLIVYGSSASGGGVKDISENLTTDFPIPEYNIKRSALDKSCYVTGIDHPVMLVQTNEWRI